jgi:hypothetical protein
VLIAAGGRDLLNLSEMLDRLDRTSFRMSAEVREVMRGFAQQQRPG